MLDWEGEVNRHPATAVEVSVVTSKIIPVVEYIVSTAVRLHSCTELTSLVSSGGGHFQADVSVDTVQWEGGGGSSAAVVSVE